MDIIDDKNFMPLGLGSELTTESFGLAQYSNTYLLSAPRYYQFYASYIKPRINMYTGWVNGFHNIEYGIIPTLFIQKIGNGIINTLFSKPIVLNSFNATTNQIIGGKHRKKSNFNSAVKEAYAFAEAGGTALLKINKDENEDLRYEAIPMDKFFCEVDGYGDIEKTKSFIATYHDTISASVEYHLCEERFFKYVWMGGRRKRFPMVHYMVYQTSTNITYDSLPRGGVAWSDVPKEIRDSLRRDYGDIIVDERDCDSLNFDSSRKNPTQWEKCKLLPFDDDLGCRLIKFTKTIPSFPKMPFGQPLADLLMNESFQYDQLKFFERVEVYAARARAMMDDCNSNPNDPEARKRALDPVVFNYYYNPMTDGKDGKPELLQPELRAEQIKAQKQNILNDTAFAINISSSTIAAWLSDGTTQKTATEIEYERTKTESFIADKIDIIQQPLQELTDIYFHFYGTESPELRIMPESQASHTEIMRVYSELYDGGKIPPKMLAERILNTCSYKDIKDLEEYIETHSKQTQMPSQDGIPQESGAAENPYSAMAATNASFNKIGGTNKNADNSKVAKPIQ